MSSPAQYPPQAVVLPEGKAIVTIPLNAIPSMAGSRGSTGAGAAGSSACQRICVEVSKYGISVYISLGEGWYVTLYFSQPKEKVTQVTQVTVDVAAVVAAAGRYVRGSNIDLPGAVKVLNNGSTIEFAVAGGDAAWNDYDQQWRSKGLTCPMSVVQYRGWGPRNAEFDHSVAYGV